VAESDSLYAVLSLALGLGMAHALDADHIVAVSGLASARATFRDTLRFCLRWSLGHGVTIMLLGAAVLLLGMAIPATLSHYAEEAVGFVLIGIGIYVLWDLLLDKAHIHFHAHDEISPHAHWHRHSKTAAPHRHTQGALMIGMLHGAAGSAPLLTLLPLSAQSQPWFGVVYLLMFGMGVLLSMLVFGGALGALFRGVATHSNQGVRMLRLAVALGSISFGSYLVHSAY